MPTCAQPLHEQDGSRLNGVVDLVSDQHQATAAVARASGAYWATARATLGTYLDEAAHPQPAGRRDVIWAGRTPRRVQASRYEGTPALEPLTAREQQNLGDASEPGVATRAGVAPLYVLGGANRRSIMRRAHVGVHMLAPQGTIAELLATARWFLPCRTREQEEHRVIVEVLPQRS